VSVAAGLLLYAALVSWLGPRVLAKITTRGINPLLGVTAWLTAIVGVLGAWGAAVIVLALDAVDALSSSVVGTMCLEFLGHVGQIDMARPVAATIAVTLIGTSLALSLVFGLRIVRTLRTLRTASHEHAMTARVVGRPTQWRDVFVVNADQAAAYCVSGRPRAIVVTSAALASLEDDQLAAVLAHEYAHLTGRHHQLLMVLRAAAAGIPSLPLLAAGPEAVSRLLEMNADDSAARRHGRHPLLCGMMTLVGHPTVPAPALGAANTAVLDRAARLAVPAPTGARWRDRVTLWTAIGLTIAVPLFTGVLCHH
jgi:beta-lactamase regulating signal transducer with metallopeptidase domain